MILIDIQHAISEFLFFSNLRLREPQANPLFYGGIVILPQFKIWKTFYNSIFVSLRIQLH